MHLDLETAKELKAAGFPQKANRTPLGTISFSKPMGMNEPMPYFPDLEEIILECGEMYMSLEKVGKGYAAIPRKWLPGEFFDISPKKAVALLYIALRKQK